MEDGEFVTEVPPPLPSTISFHQDAPAPELDYPSLFSISNLFLYQNIITFSFFYKALPFKCFFVHMLVDGELGEDRCYSILFSNI